MAQPLFGFDSDDTLADRESAVRSALCTAAGPAEKSAARASAPMHLAVALDWADHGQGEASTSLLDPRYWTGLVDLARQATLDFVVVEDSLAPPAADGSEAARLDAVLTLCRVAPQVADVGLIPAVTTTHTEPFHVSKAIATLDWISKGRAGWQAEVSTTEQEAGHIGRRPAPAGAELWQEAEEAVDVVRRLWDSWEDDAEIRDAATGRFLDRDKVHRIDFQGRFFSVKGPAIVPRSPQGQPLVVLRVSGGDELALAARHADVVRLAAASPSQAAETAGLLREQARLAGRAPGEPRILADLAVLLTDGHGPAREHEKRIAALAARTGCFTGTAEQLADTLGEWRRRTAVDGFTLLPSVLPDDLERLAKQAAPALRRRGLLRERYTATTLRGHFGLERPANRYVTT